jgi:hypothetical protein
LSPIRRSRRAAFTCGCAAPHSSLDRAHGKPERAQKFDAQALAVLVQVMEDEGASASARVRAAECVLDRAHGKAAPVLEQPSDPDFVPLAERIKYYMRRDAIEAAEAEGEIVTAARLLAPRTPAAAAEMLAIVGHNRQGPTAFEQLHEPRAPVFVLRHEAPERRCHSSLGSACSVVARIQQSDNIRHFAPEVSYDRPARRLDSLAP